MINILVPVDFSQSSTTAVDFAVKSAKFLNADVLLLHAFDVKNNLYTDYMGVNKEFNQTQLNEAKNKLIELKDKIERTEEIVIDTIVDQNSLYRSIQEITEKQRIRLIVMGTAGESSLKKILFGSNTAAIIGKSKVPVMVVPQGYQWKKPEKILFATNHFESEKHFLDLLFEMADLFMAQVNLGVFSDEENTTALAFIDESNKLSSYENMIRRTYNEESITATYLLGDDFQRSLDNYIDENHIDILVMVNYERGFWGNIFRTSMTRAMSYHTKIPLLAIPGKH